MVYNRVVVKFGGADLSTGEKIKHAAMLVVDSPYKEKVVVVSAMGNATDTLANVIKEIDQVSDADYAQVVSMGERTSARVFGSALNAQGAKAIVFDPDGENWPIITDSNFRDAKPDIEQTCSRVQKFVEPILKDSIPIVCGFLGRDSEGQVTTLGRGGSDTTALLLANCLEAEEVVLVKETLGVLSADPHIIPNAKPLEKLDVHEMLDLAQGGAKIVKPESLTHKLRNQKLRIVNFASPSLASSGTEITGSINTSTAERTTHRNLVAINVLCEVNAESLQRIFGVLRSKPIYGISSGRRSITVFTTDGNVHEVLNKLHATDGLKAISHREKVAMLQLSHPMFIDSPGGVAKMSVALSQKGINIIEVTTSKTTINVFIEENQLQKATEAINHVFEA
jgi:aspartate kinase